MYKTLAISALLGASNARNDQGLQIAQGLLERLGTAQGLDGVNQYTCDKSIQQGFDQARTAIADFKKADLNDMIEGLKQVAGMLEALGSGATNDCRSKNNQALLDIAKVWQNPLTFAYHAGKDLIINGSDIYPDMSDAINALDQNDFYTLGSTIAQASVKIQAGKDTYMENRNSGRPTAPAKKDPKIHYAQKMGSEIAAGFLFGASITNGVHEDRIFECLGRDGELGADKLFMEADIQLRRSISDNNPGEAVEGLYEMLKFFFEMGKDGKQSCADLHDPKMKPNIDIARHMIQELRDPTSTGIRKGSNGEVLFNNQDITKEVYQMADSYTRHDYKKLGYIFGDALEKHLKQRDHQKNLFLY